MPRSHRKGQLQPRHPTHPPLHLQLPQSHNGVPRLCHRSVATQLSPLPSNSMEHQLHRQTFHPRSVTSMTSAHIPLNYTTPSRTLGLGLITTRILISLPQLCLTFLAHQRRDYIHLSPNITTPLLPIRTTHQHTWGSTDTPHSLTIPWQPNGSNLGAHTSEFQPGLASKTLTVRRTASQILVQHFTPTTR